MTNGPYRSNISPHSKTAMVNRYSVISDASSNTTSGIASDKMTVSFEDSDGKYRMSHEKTCFCHMRTTKVQISLHLRTV